jgi:hypothetical protein
LIYDLLCRRQGPCVSLLGKCDVLRYTRKQLANEIVIHRVKQSGLHLVLRKRTLSHKIDDLPLVTIRNLFLYLLDRLVVLHDRLVAAQAFNLCLDGPAPLFQVEVALGSKCKLPGFVLDLKQERIGCVEVRWVLLPLLLGKLGRVQAHVSVVQDDQVEVLFL